MKKSAFVLAIGIISILFGCHKSTTRTDNNCGCNSDSVWHSATYYNFGGFNNYQALLGYTTLNNQSGWFIGVSVPNTNYSAILKICNPDLNTIRAYTDTSTRQLGIPVHFSGKLKMLCPGESFGTQLPETLTGYVTIDSLQKK